MNESSSKRHGLLVAVFLVLISFAVYWHGLSNGFVNYDDPEYLSKRVLAGPTLQNVKWAIANTESANWHPLTWLSHMLDCRLYGPNAMGHHLTSYLFHVVNVLLLFLLFVRLTGGIWRSGFLAALFAVHPLHVESVAWVSERKDVLSAFFWLLAMLAYVGYVRHRSVRRYVLILLAFVMGLMAKSMIVTLPLSLLILDYWPLGRMAPKARSGESFGHLLAEKLPLFAVAAAGALIAVIAQRSGGALNSLDHMSLAVRLDNVPVSYCGYLVKTVWPLNLSVFYPHPANTLEIWRIILSSLALLCLSYLAWRARFRYPSVTAGWLWYLLTLLPVIGIVQIGSQAMADRYTYIPLIGVFAAVAWLVPSSARSKTTSRVFLCGGLIVVLLLGAQAYRQVGYWRDAKTLFTHALDVEPRNPLAHLLLANTLRARGETDEAIEHYRAALEVKPGSAPAHLNLGLALSDIGDLKEARNELSQAVHYDPASVQARMNLGVVLGMQGKLDASISELKEAEKLEPNNVEVHRNLLYAYFLKRQYARAWKEAHTLVRLDYTVPPAFLRRLSRKMPDPGS